ncbi:hypothetical protein L0F63_006557 [Massospora cicadina]|nr:hypothetical protein L0F63_006557 [Massospora cicadina]
MSKVLWKSCSVQWSTAGEDADAQIRLLVGRLTSPARLARRSVQGARPGRPTSPAGESKLLYNGVMKDERSKAENTGGEASAYLLHSDDSSTVYFRLSLCFCHRSRLVSAYTPDVTSKRFNIVKSLHSSRFKYTKHGKNIYFPSGGVPAPSAATSPSTKCSSCTLTV